MIFTFEAPYICAYIIYVCIVLCIGLTYEYTQSKICRPPKTRCNFFVSLKQSRF